LGATAAAGSRVPKRRHVRALRNAHPRNERGAHIGYHFLLRSRGIPAQPMCTLALGHESTRCRHPPFPALAQEPDRYRIAIQFSIACLNRRNDDENDVKNVEQNQNWDSDQHDDENSGDDIVDQHRQLEVQGFFPVRVDLRGFAAL